MSKGLTKYNADYAQKLGVKSGVKSENSNNNLYHNRNNFSESNLTPFIGMWLAFNIILFATGIFEETNCKKPMKIIELVFPGYQMGCFAAKPLLGEK